MFLEAYPCLVPVAVEEHQSVRMIQAGMPVIEDFVKEMLDEKR